MDLASLARKPNNKWNFYRYGDGDIEISVEGELERAVLASTEPTWKSIMVGDKVRIRFGQPFGMESFDEIKRFILDKYYPLAKIGI